MKQNSVRKEEHCGFGRGNRFDEFFQGSKVSDEKCFVLCTFFDSACYRGISKVVEI